MPRPKQTTTVPEIEVTTTEVKKYGIKELSDVILLICSFLYALSKSKGVDGSWRWRDSLKFMGAFKRVPDAINGILEVPKEIKDLDEEELAEIHKLVNENFKLNDNEKEARIKEMIDVAFRVIEIVQKLF